MTTLLRYNDFINEEILPEDKIGNYRDYISKFNSEGKVVDIDWYINNDEIKVFLDITSISDKEQTLFGKGIILWGAIKNWVRGKFKNSLNKVNHIGFVFKDGYVLHATTSGSGIQFERYEDVIENPNSYIVYNLGGNEKDIRQLGENLLKDIEKAGVDKIGKQHPLYDTKGIVRQILPKWLSNLFFKEETNLKFYCSELVANLLVSAKVISLDELKMVKENLTELDKYDEVDPTKLYGLLIDKGTMADLLVEFDDGKKEIFNIDKVFSSPKVEEEIPLGI